MLRAMSIVIVSLLLTSCASAPPATPDSSNAETEVVQASDRFWAARDRGDASALAEHFTETGIYMVPGLLDAEGRDAIRELLKRRLAAVKITDFEVRRRELSVKGDIAHELGWFAETNRPGKGDAMRMQGRYLTVWQRGADGLWRVHRHFYAFSDAVPVE